MEKNFKVTKVEPVSGGGWRIEFDSTSGSNWSEIPSSKSDVEPQVGEDVIFTFPEGCNSGSVTVGGRLYVSAR